MGEIRELEVLVVVKAYPNPSQGLSEAVCVAGISKELGFVRLYPIPFRDLDDARKFAKYQVVRLRGRKPKQDGRPNTFRPDLESLQPVGDPLSTADRWRARREWVLPWASDSMCQIQRQQERTGISLGVFKPAEVIDVEQQEDESCDWMPAELAKLNQQDLFVTKDKKPLEKIPFSWRYHYRCADPHCKTHCQQIIDWEIAEFYRNCGRRGITHSEEIHAQVRKKFLAQLCGPDKDVYFFTGNMARYPQSFLMLGVFWPPKDPQMNLF